MRHLHDHELFAIADGNTVDEAWWEHLAGCPLCASLVAEAVAPATVSVGRDRGYTVGREIARGGMGRVLRGFDVHLHRDVAIKISTVSSDDHLRFRREVELTARLQHPNIIPIYDAGELDGAPFYAMRPVAGQRLDERIAATGTRDARLELLPHVIAVVDAIAYAHRQGVIHRDLKPQNVLVGEFGETVVIDWGLGKLVDEDDGPIPSVDSNETVAGAVVGTPGYMAPEQARGEAVDRRVDVYALGCVLFQTLTGEVPHAGPPVVVLAAVADGTVIDVDRRAPELPAELRAIIAKAAAPDPARRYADAGELASDLRRYQAGLLVAAHRYRWYQRVARGVRRHRLAVSIAASVLVSAAIVGGIAIRSVIAERDRANTERAAAVGLLGYLVDELPAKLRAIGQIEVLADASARLDAYYTAVNPARAESSDELVRVAEVRSLRGELASRAGRAEESRALSAEAVELARQAEAGDPVAARPILARMLVERGSQQYQLGKLAEAIASFEEGLAILDALPPTPGNRHARTGAAMRLAGIAIAQSGLDDAGRWLAAAHASLGSGEARDVLYQMQRQSIEYLDAQRAFALRDLPAASAHLAESIDAAKQVQHVAPWRPDGHDALARCEVMQGAILVERDDIDGAARALGDAVTVLRTLRELDGDNADWQASLATTLGDLADLAERRGGKADAMRDESLALLDGLLVREPDNPNWLQLAIRVLRESGRDLDRAEALARRLPRGVSGCTLVDLARDRAAVALAAKDLAAARGQLDRATAILDAARSAPAPCARFQPFEVLIDRAIATPDSRAKLLDEARAMAAALKAQGVDASIAATLQERIDSVK